MTYKQIEASREIRLWISQVFVPAALVAGAVMSNPEARKTVEEKYDKAKNWAKSKLNKKG